MASCSSELNGIMTITPQRTKHGRTLLLVCVAVLLAFAVAIVVMIRRQRPIAPNKPLHEETMLVQPASHAGVSFRTAQYPLLS